MMTAKTSLNALRSDCSYPLRPRTLSRSAAEEDTTLITLAKAATASVTIYAV